jgi:hypothetical protein
VEGAGQGAGERLAIKQEPDAVRFAIAVLDPAKAASFGLRSSQSHGTRFFVYRTLDHSASEPGAALLSHGGMI